MTPTRRVFLRRLALSSRPLTTAEVARGRCQPLTATRHLKALRDDGYVVATRSDSYGLQYALTDAGRAFLDELDDG